MEYLQVDMMLFLGNKVCVRTATLLHRHTALLPMCCSLQANKKEEEEAKFAEAVAARVALRKRAEEMAAMARGDVPKVNELFNMLYGANEGVRVRLTGQLQEGTSGQCGGSVVFAVKSQERSSPFDPSTVYEPFPHWAWYRSCPEVILVSLGRCWP